MIDDLVNNLVRDEGSITNDRGRHIVYDCPAGLNYWLWYRSRKSWTV